MLQLCVYFHNLCPRLRLLIKLINYQDLPSQRNDNITNQIQTAQYLVPTWTPIRVSLRNTEAQSRYHTEQECIFFLYHKIMNMAQVNNWQGKESFNSTG